MVASLRRSQQQRCQVKTSADERQADRAREREKDRHRQRERHTEGEKETDRETDIHRGVHPQKPMMHFNPILDFLPLFRIFQSLGKFFQLFPKMYVSSTQKTSDALF